MTDPAQNAPVDVLVAYASRHGATRGVAETREPRGIDPLREAARPRDYRVFAGVIRREQWPLPSRMLYHAFGGHLGDNRDWADIDAWADGIAAALTQAAAAEAA